jgi:hypothetical protein
MKRPTTVAIPAELRARLEAYAERNGISVLLATVALLEMGLRAHERAVAAGKVRGARVTPEQARAAVATRWSKRESS